MKDRRLYKNFVENAILLEIFLADFQYEHKSALLANLTYLFGCLEKQFFKLAK